MFNECFLIELVLTPRIYIEKDHNMMLQTNDRINFKKITDFEIDEGTGDTGYCGLVNEGNTCYINSLL